MLNWLLPEFIADVLPSEARKMEDLRRKIDVYKRQGYYQRKQTAQASQLYYEMQNAVMSDDNERALRVAKDTQEKFGRTAYAPMVTLVAAKMAYEENKIDVAKTQLQWVVDNAKRDGYNAIARLRLAGILRDEKAYDEGDVYKRQGPEN